MTSESLKLVNIGNLLTYNSKKKSMSKIKVIKVGKIIDGNGNLINNGLQSQSPIRKSQNLYFQFSIPQ